MSKRLNILFIIMDDQRADTLAGYGVPRPRTPNLDALVENGLQFKNTFLTTPICTPGRAEVLTGCHTFQNEVPWFGMPINPDLMLLPRHLQHNGYHTIHVGKWHNDGHSRDKGYSRTRRDMINDNLLPYRENGHTMRFQEEDGSSVEGHSTELFTDAAIEELQQAPEDKPWFCYLAYHSPHDPFDCPPPFDTAYSSDEVPLPENYMPEARADNGDLTIRDELLLPWPRTQAAIRDYIARYWCMISHHDHHIGRILRHLDETGERDNTLIVFTGDHGLAAGSHGLLGKENMYDHSCRIPLVFSGPGVPKGQTCEALVANRDIFPTLCDAAGIPQADSIADGVSLAEAFTDPDKCPCREHVVTAFISPASDGSGLRHTQRAIRTSEWKLVHYLLTGRYELYNVREDPFELNNLLEPYRFQPDPMWQYTPERDPDDLKAIAEKLRSALIQWQQENNDPAASIVANNKLFP